MTTRSTEEGPFSAEQLDVWDCPIIAAEQAIHPEFYERVDEGWMRRFRMLAVVLPSSPHKITNGASVQVLFEGEQEGSVQLTGHNKPTYATLERGEQYIELDSGAKILSRWVMHCLHDHKPKV